MDKGCRDVGVGHILPNSPGVAWLRHIEKGPALHSNGGIRRLEPAGSGTVLNNGTDFLNDCRTDWYTMQKPARSDLQIGLVEER